MENHVSLDLMEFIERNILPRYTEFDKAHSMQHVTGVIRRSLERMTSHIGDRYRIASSSSLQIGAPDGFPLVMMRASVKGSPSG